MNVSLQTTSQLPLSAQVSYAKALQDWTSTERTKTPCDPAHLCVEELVLLSQKEMRRYLRTSESDTQYSFELFRRALAEQDEAAWYALSQLYHGLVLSWVRHHSKFATSGEEADYFVNRAFERLWRYVALKPGKFDNFTDLASILQYTKMCAHAAVMDDAPAAPIGCTTLDPEDAESGQRKEAAVGSTQVSNAQQERCSSLKQNNFIEIEQTEFWQTIEKFLLDETERITIFGFFVEGLKNRELLALYPDHFEDAKQVSNKRTSILRRLSRNDEFRELLQDFFHDGRDLFGQLIC